MFQGKTSNGKQVSSSKKGAGKRSRAVGNGTIEKDQTLIEDLSRMDLEPIEKFEPQDIQTKQRSPSKADPFQKKELAD